MKKNRKIVIFKTDRSDANDIDALNRRSEESIMRYNRKESQI